MRIQGESEDLTFPLLLLFSVQVTKEVCFSKGSKVRCFPKLRHCLNAISDFFVFTNLTNSRAKRTKFDDELRETIKRRCDRGSGKSELPKQKRNARVFERAKHKTTHCVPCKCENTVSSTIITFLDKTNLRKQTSVHLL